MNYVVGQILNLERCAIYSTQGKLRESTREVASVENMEDGRIVIQFKGSKIKYNTREDSEWIQTSNRRYRNLDWSAS